MQRIVIKRFGDSPLAFSGRMLSVAGDRPQNALRWHELELYETAGGYIPVAKYVSSWPPEPACAVFAEPCATIAEVGQFFQNYDPLTCFIGPPENHRKTPLIKSVTRQQYLGAVTQLFDLAGLSVEPFN